MPNSQYWFQKGLDFSDKKEYEKAIECYEKAVKIDPKLVNAWNNMGIAYENLKEYKKAIECYEKTVELDPKDSKAWNNLGETYDKLENYNKAIKCYEKVLEIDPQRDDIKKELNEAKNKLTQLEKETQEQPILQIINRLIDIYIDTIEFEKIYKEFKKQRNTLRDLNQDEKEKIDDTIENLILQKIIDAHIDSKTKSLVIHKFPTRKILKISSTKSQTADGVYYVIWIKVNNISRKSITNFRIKLDFSEEIFQLKQDTTNRQEVSEIRDDAVFKYIIYTLGPCANKEIDAEISFMYDNVKYDKVKLETPIKFVVCDVFKPSKNPITIDQLEKKQNIICAEELFSFPEKIEPKSFFDELKHKLPLTITKEYTIENQLGIEFQGEGLHNDPIISVFETDGKIGNYKICSTWEANVEGLLKELGNIIRVMFSKLNFVYQETILRGSEFAIPLFYEWQKDSTQKRGHLIYRAKIFCPHCGELSDFLDIFEEQKKWLKTAKKAAKIFVSACVIVPFISRVMGLSLKYLSKFPDKEKLIENYKIFFENQDEINEFISDIDKVFESVNSKIQQKNDEKEIIELLSANREKFLSEIKTNEEKEFWDCTVKNNKYIKQYYRSCGRCGYYIHKSNYCKEGIQCWIHNLKSENLKYNDQMIQKDEKNLKKEVNNSNFTGPVSKEILYRLWEVAKKKDFEMLSQARKALKLESSIVIENALLKFFDWLSKFNHPEYKNIGDAVTKWLIADAGIVQIAEDWDMFLRMVANLITSTQLQNGLKVTHENERISELIIPDSDDWIRYIDKDSFKVTVIEYQERHRRF